MRKEAGLAQTEAAERRMLQRIRVAEAVMVTAFDEGTMTADVKPLVKREVSGAYVSPPPILSVKVAYIPAEVEVNGEKGTVKAAIKPGDIGIVAYLDSDSDNALRTGTESQPNSSRRHSGDDAVLIGIVIPG